MDFFLLFSLKNFNAKKKSFSTDEKNNDYSVKKRTTHFGSFYLRVGAISFGIGTMVYSGLEFGQFFELNRKKQLFQCECTSLSLKIYEGLRVKIAFFVSSPAQTYGIEQEVRRKREQEVRQKRPFSLLTLPI